MTTHDLDWPVDIATLRKASLDQILHRHIAEPLEDLLQAGIARQTALIDAMKVSGLSEQHLLELAEQRPEPLVEALTAIGVEYMKGESVE